MQSSINHTTITSNNYCYRQRCSRVDVINQILAKKQQNKNTLFQSKFQQFYRDRMQLNKIQKKDQLELHDQMVQLYKNNQTIQQVNLSISTQDNNCFTPYSKPIQQLISKRRPRSQSTQRASNSQTKRPLLTDLLRISPKCISNRTTISSRNDVRSVRKNIFLDALILQQDSQEMF